MKVRVAVLAAAAALFAMAQALAAQTAHETFVSKEVIDAGPKLMPWETNNNNGGWGQAELAYLQEVCPTVLHDPGQYKSSLVRFYNEPHGG